jgi:hypothetical protein
MRLLRLLSEEILLNFNFSPRCVAEVLAVLLGEVAELTFDSS